MTVSPKSPTSGQRSTSDETAAARRRRRCVTKSLTSPPKIYVLSNYASPEYRHECELVGADAFFDKSGEYDRFLDTLQRVAH